MISDIYILAYSMLGWLSEDEQPFHKYILEVLPDCLMDHLPDNVDVVSIDYKEDELINSLLYFLVTDMSGSIIDDIREKVVVESGYFHIRLDAEEDLSMRRNEVLEFIFSELHKSYYCTSSFFCYLGDEVIHHFSSVYIDKDNLFEAVDEFEKKDISHLTPLLKAYLYKGEIPDQFVGDIAKMMLVRSV